MRKIIFFVILVVTTRSYAQELFILGNKSYPATPTFELQSKINQLSKTTFSIAKNGKSGLLILSVPATEGVGVKGNSVLYLDDGTVITLIDRGLRDHVDETSIQVYSLTEAEIEKLKNSNVNTIRYSIKCFTCQFSTEEGNYTAKNLPDENSFTKSKRIDIPSAVNELFDN